MFKLFVKLLLLISFLNLLSCSHKAIRLNQGPQNLVFYHSSGQGGIEFAGKIDEKLHDKLAQQFILKNGVIDSEIKLKSTNLKNILNSLNINNNHKIFIFNLDTAKTKVKNIPKEPVGSMVFDEGGGYLSSVSLSLPKFSFNHNNSYLIYFGYKNPFIDGQLKKIALADH